MAAHRYWRIYNSRTFSSESVFIGELQLRTEVGGASVASGGTPLSSATPDSTYAASEAFDGAAGASGSGWRVTASPSLNTYASGAWLGYDFGAGNEKDIVEISISNGSYTTYTTMPQSFAIQYSDDGVQWFTARRHYEQTAWSATNTVRTYSAVPLDSAAIVNRLVDSTLRTAKAIGELQVDTVQLDSYRLICDPRFGGLYRLAGSTTSLGFPASRRVRLYHQVSGQLAGQVLTGPDGAFEFTNIEEGPWTVVGVDDTGVQNGVLFTHVLAVPM